MKRFAVDDMLSLRLMEQGDAEDLMAVVDANREHLSAWLRWVDKVRDIEAMRLMVGEWVELRERTGAQQWGVELDGRLSGMVYHLRPNLVDQHVEVGYWLAASVAGRGAVTRSVGLLIDYTFRQWGMHRVQVRIAPHNTASLKVAQRLGLVKEGVTRHAWRVGEQWWDAVEFSALSTQWTATSPPIRFETRV